MQSSAIIVALVASLVSMQPVEAKAPVKASSTRKSKAKAPPKKTPPTYKAETVNDANNHPDLAPKAVGAAALRAQILLDRANFSVGEIDGTIGSNTISALNGIRDLRKLSAGEGVDQATWQVLNKDTDAALVPYTITATDLKGPFVKVPVDMMAKAKLTYLGYSSPLEALGEKFHISPALLRQLNPGKGFMRIGEKITVPNVLTTLNTQAAKIVVSKSEKTVTAFDEAGNVIAQYPCSSGSDHDPLPIGDWKVTGVAKNPKFHYNPDLFWDAKEDQAKATIPAGPRNPVGLVWIDLSKEHYGIHGTPSPSTIGYKESHGCIRLTNWDALELASIVKPGTPASLIE
jgi:lipoprotein-anchoring transpeptidase ErfK/SrfK